MELKKLKQSLTDIVLGARRAGWGIAAGIGLSLLPLEAKAQEVSTNINISGSTNNASAYWPYGTQHMFNASAGPGGSISGNTNDGWFFYGSNVNVNANPDSSHYTFSKWTNCPAGSEGNSNLNFNITNAWTNVIAMFNPDSHTLIVYAPNFATNYLNPPGTNFSLVHGEGINLSTKDIITNGAPAGTRYKLIGPGYVVGNDYTNPTNSP